MVAPIDVKVPMTAITCTKMSHCFGSNIFWLVFEYLIPCMARPNKLIVSRVLAIYDKISQDSFR